MPRAKSSTVGFTPEFSAMETTRKMIGEKNDCAVKAIALLCDKPYSEVLAFINAQGRKAGRGTGWRAIRAAFEHYGFHLELWSRRTFIDRYPPCHQILRSITTHHPERFNNVWRDGKRYLFDCGSHVAAVIDGKNHDWTKGRAKRVDVVYEVVKNGGAT